MSRRLHCDESIWLPVADGLRRRGWGVRTASEQGTLGHADRDQLAHAVANDRVLLTFDDDFLSLVECEGRDHAGLVYVQQAGRKIGDVVKTVDGHLEARAPDDRSITYL